jgi:hypothetical protein
MVGERALGPAEFWNAVMLWRHHDVGWAMGGPSDNFFGVPSPPLWGSEAVRGSGFPPQILDLNPGGPSRAAR